MIRCTFLSAVAVAPLESVDGALSCEYGSWDSGSRLLVPFNSTSNRGVLGVDGEQKPSGSASCSGMDRLGVSSGSTGRAWALRGVLRLGVERVDSLAGSVLCLGLDKGKSESSTFTSLVWTETSCRLAITGER